MRDGINLGAIPDNPPTSLLSNTYMFKITKANKSTTMTMNNHPLDTFIYYIPIQKQIEPYQVLLFIHPFTVL